MIDICGHRDQVKTTGASLSNMIGILSSWEAASESDLRLKAVAMDRLQHARLAMLDLWNLVKPITSEVDRANGKR